MPAGDLYEQDFYTWTQEQARRLRTLRRDNSLDAARLAEEIADLGKRERRELESHLHQALRHLIKLAWNPAGEPAAHWRREVRDHLRAAQRTLRDSPSLRGRVELTALWETALADANADLLDHGEPGGPAAAPCPVALDTLLASDTTVDDLIQAVRPAA